MTDLEQWHQGNQRYLAAALEWLRLRLKNAPGRGPATPADLPIPDQNRPPHLSGQAGEAAAAAGRHAAGAADDAVGAAEKKMREAEETEPPPGLLILARRLALSRFEMEVLLLCSAMEFDTGIASLCARAQQNETRPYPTFALALGLFDDPAWDVLSPERPLRYWRLIEINHSYAQALTASQVRADERVANYVKGLNYLDDRLAPLLLPLPIADLQPQLSRSQLAAVELVMGPLQQQPPAHGGAIVQLIGPDPVSKDLLARQVASALGLYLYRLPVELLPQQAAELETLARLWQRESLLLPVCMFIDNHEVDGAAAQEGSAQGSLRRFLARRPGLVMVSAQETDPALGDGESGITVDVEKPAPEEQQAAWKAALGEKGQETARQLAAQFNLNLSTIRQLAEPVITEQGSGSGDERYRRLWQACLGRTRPRLDRLAQRIEPKAKKDDLVLPEEPRSLLYEIMAHIRQRSVVYDTWGFRRTMNRGLGISALFAGESGTGKTMAAEVIANELQLNLYRIDLSAVVSKYIGETEKNLRRLFDAAEDGGVILFFDEADALFGKRSEIRDSHDRYANIEINYLLQRMECFQGLAILATNMKSALDQAFMRRLRFIVNFPFPGVKERQQIWEKVFPKEDKARGIAGTPTKELDYAHLAKLNLTGGSIHNIALNAAFLAAWADTPVTMDLIFDAARTELRKIEKPVNEAELRLPSPAAGAA